MPKVAAVLLSWNDAGEVLALLESLRGLSRGPDRVFVVDNGSAEAELARIASAFPEHRLLPLGRNFGFATAVNRGIEAALADGADWIWLLNSDIELPASVLDELLAAAAQDARCGMASPVFVETDGSVQALGGGRVNLWTGISRHVLRAGESCDYMMGACLLLRADMLRRIGLFDEDYFFYWEDVDLSFRARAAGWSFAVVAGCRVVHREGTSLGRWSRERWFHLFHGMQKFLRRHAPLPRAAIAFRLLHHSAAMLKHGRIDAIRGAWTGALQSRARAKR